jgi:ribosomal-protein-alanine N-acetyltransferase
VPADFPAYAAFRASERARILGGPYAADVAFEQLAALIGHWQLRGFGRWIVADKATDAPLGVVGPFHPLDWPEPEIAWSVFETAEGRGVAYEAAFAARAWAYAHLGWTTAISMIDPANLRSVRLAERLGARPDGVFPHADYGQMTIWRHPGPGMTPAWENPPQGPSATLANAICALVPVLETARTRLRGMRLADFDAWAGILCSDRAWGMDGPYSRDEAYDEFAITVATWALHGFGFWTVEDRHSGEVLGFCGLNMEVSNREPELGYFVTEQAEGRGLAREAAGAAKAWAMTRGLTSLVSYVDPENDRSIAVAVALGAVRDRRAEAEFAGTDDADTSVWRYRMEGT